MTPALACGASVICEEKTGFCSSVPKIPRWGLIVNRCHSWGGVFQKSGPSPPLPERERVGRKSSRGGNLIALESNDARDDLRGVRVKLVDIKAKLNQPFDQLHDHFAAFQVYLLHDIFNCGN